MNKANNEHVNSFSCGAQYSDIRHLIEAERLPRSNKKKAYFLSIGLAVSLVVTLGAVAVSNLISDNRPEGDYSIQTPEIVADTFDKVLGKAAILTVKRSRDKNNNSLGKEAHNRNIKYLKNGFYSVKYPFDFISIKNAKEYNLYLDEKDYFEGMEQIISQTGFGNMKIILSDFVAGVSTQEGDGTIISTTIDGGRTIEDKLITIYSESGQYSCLINGWSEKDGGLYSSHKQLGDDSVIKIPNPPYYGILVNDGKLYFAKNDYNSVSLGDFDKKREFTYNLESEYIADEETFEISELVD